MSAILVRYWCS